MIYPQTVIEDVRLGNDILDVVSTYVRLKQNGPNYFGLCPFHHEKTPSFSVRPDRQMFHCFGCGVSGNVISFVMQIENYSFIDALKHLAERIRYTLPEHQASPEALQLARYRERAYEIYKVTARYYFDALSTNEGGIATRYMDERRIDPRLRKRFGLGYAPIESMALYRYLSSNGFSDNEIEKSSMLAPDKRGGFYDRFRGRLMFPILDVSGRVVGFGGRILAGEGAKYINSPDSIIFNKSRNLYGINLARKSKSREYILCEGYMDVLSLHQAGFTNAVAALGTAFNAEHAKQLRSYCDNVILLFDSDNAGVNAAQRAIPILSETGIGIRVLRIDNAKDPDEYIKTFGAEAFAEQIVKATHHVRFRIDVLKAQYDLSDTAQRVKFTAQAAEILAGLKNAIEQDAFIKDVSDMTGISQKAIAEEMAKQNPDAAIVRPMRLRNFERGDKLERGVTDARRGTLYLAAKYPRVAEALRDNLNTEEFCDEVYARLYQIILECASSGKQLYGAEAVGYFENRDEQNKVAAVFVTDTNGNDIYDKPEEVLQIAVNDMVRLIKRHFVEIKSMELDYLQKILEMKRNMEKLYISV